MAGRELGLELGSFIRGGDLSLDLNLDWGWGLPGAWGLGLCLCLVPTAPAFVCMFLLECSPWYRQTDRQS